MAGGLDTGSLIGVDAGSTQIKAVLVASGSGVLHVARRPTPTHAVSGGAYHDPAELLAAVELVIAECAAVAVSRAGGPGGSGAPSGSRVPGGSGGAGVATPIAGIGVAGMAEAGVPIDAAGHPIGRIMAWYDARPAPQAQWLERQVGASELFARTGLRPEPKYTLPKLLWLRDHAPRAVDRMRGWAGVPELIAHHLTGELATNASLACRTAAFNLAALGWDAELLGLAGVTPEQMPRVVPLGAAVGWVTEVAARRLGVAAGTPVTVAGHDHMVGALGAGVVRPGEALDSMGSAEVAALFTAVPPLADEGRRSGFSCGCHAVDGVWYLAGGLQASGALMEWFIDWLLDPRERDALPLAGPAAATDRYAAFLDLLAGSAPPPAGPIVLPYLRGRTAPRPDRSATLAIQGLTEAHSLADLAAAFVDGAAFHVRWMFDELERLTATSPRRTRVIGGGARNPRWLAAKAALGPGRLEVARTEEAVALGAALAAGMAAGVYSGLAAALRDATPAHPVRASARLAHLYEAAYRDRWLPAALA